MQPLSIEVCPLYSETFMNREHHIVTYHTKFEHSLNIVWLYERFWLLMKYFSKGYDIGFSLTLGWRYGIFHLLVDGFRV